MCFLSAPFAETWFINFLLLSLCYICTYLQQSYIHTHSQGTSYNSSHYRIHPHSPFLASQDPNQPPASKPQLPALALPPSLPILHHHANHSLALYGWREQGNADASRENLISITALPYGVVSSSGVSSTVLYTNTCRPPCVHKSQITYYLT